MLDATQTMQDLLTMWTEPDTTRRRQTIERYFHVDARFHDYDGSFAGHDEIQGFCDSLQQRRPGAVFTLIKADAVGNSFRGFWSFGGVGLLTVTGMDLAVVHNDRISTLYAYVDLPPDAQS